MNIVIIDTGCANLASVQYSIERLGYQPIISSDPKLFSKADRVFIPGVGTAEAAMDKLIQRPLIEPIKALTQPVLGICLGMQLMASLSDEGCESIPLLNIMGDEVKKIQSGNLPMPHMGWNTVHVTKSSPLFKGIDDPFYAYFVHSYCLPISDRTLGQTTYGQTFSSIVQHRNFYGMQFHPERSSTIGTQLLRNFIEETLPC